HAYDQAVACIELLRDRVPTFQGNHAFQIPHIDAVDEFYPVCITSEHYPALSYQVGQFLRKSEDPKINNPIIMDVFTLDVITEFLRSPLYLIDYLSKRSLLAERVLSSHEMVMFSYHLRGNLYVPPEVNLFLVEDDFLCDLDLGGQETRPPRAGNASRNPYSRFEQPLGTDTQRCRRN
ncbi:MAG TPA: hypothetical protein VGA98_00730, partial [Allosphingosinicella sp.]